MTDTCPKCDSDALETAALTKTNANGETVVFGEERYCPECERWDSTVA